ncbi:MAG: N-acetyl-gamma-glutamyl-phosphate reductase [bacterium]
MTTQIKVQIVGATGYAGGDLLRILLRHPHVEIVSLVAADVDTPTAVETIWPDLRGSNVVPIHPAGGAIPDPLDLTFMATPDKVAMKLAPEYLDRGVKVIDFAGDFRFADPALHDEWYGGPHTSPELCVKAVFGLPELFRNEIPKAQLIANPGCYSTSAILGLYPAVNASVVNPQGVVVSCASGVTGAGKHPSLAFHHPETAEDFRAYKIATHRHTPEMEEILRIASGKEVRLTFVPHLLPVRRGILATMFAERTTSDSIEDIHRIYKETYAGEPFIRVLPLGEAPRLHAVQLSNFCDISVHEDPRTQKLIILAALDNTGKGASSQAVQNMNLMASLDERTGLWPTHL